MAYITQAQISSRIPNAFLVEALDDDNDGVADASAWDDVAEDAGLAVDGILGQRFAVPFADPAPAVVIECAKIFALEILFQRRGLFDAQNPWTKQADAKRSLLQTIADGDAALAPLVDRARPSVSAITEPAKTYNSGGQLPS